MKLILSNRLSSASLIAASDAAFIWTIAVFEEFAHLLAIGGVHHPVLEFAFGP